MDNSAWPLYFNGADKWKKWLQNRLTCCTLVVSSHYVVKAPLMSVIAPGTMLPRWKEGLLVGVTILSHFSFWLTPEVAPQQIQAGYRAVCQVFLRPQTANPSPCLLIHWGIIFGPVSRSQDLNGTWKNLTSTLILYRSPLIPPLLTLPSCLPCVSLD